MPIKNVFLKIKRNIAIDDTCIKKPKDYIIINKGIN